MNQEIQIYLQRLRTSDWENAMHSLIDMGERYMPEIIAAWLRENDSITKDRIFEVMSEMPVQEATPFFEEKLSSKNEAEVRAAALGLIKLNASRYEAKVVNAVQSHPVISKESLFIDYLQAAIKSWKIRR